MALLPADLSQLQTAVRQLRGDMVEFSYCSRTPHLGSALSCIDIVAALYWSNPALSAEKIDAPDRDRFILSKGHAALALYAVLARRGYFPLSMLQCFGEAGGPMVEHPVLGCMPGVEVTSGSLGHGLSLGLGMALAGRLQGYAYRVYVVISDGECNEGSTWEAAMFAPAHHLENLTVIIDYNKWQATGRSDSVMALQPLCEKWRAFGWSAKEIDGHDLGTLVKSLASVPDGSGKPVAIVANTVKGKGISFMEDDNNWHYRIPSLEEVQRAKRELELE